MIMFGRRLISSLLLLLLTVTVAAAANSNSSTEVTANSKHIKTSSLLTCMADSGLTASYFDVSYYPGNQTIVFNIDAITTITGKVVVKAELITYGLNVMQKTFDLCSLNEVALCPLNTGRIDISSTYQLDDDSLTKDIPGVAYTVPDLDAQVRVVAYAQNDTSFQKPLACVQASLGNGRTVQTKYASWPIAAISGLGILTSGFVSVMGYTVTSAHIASNSISLFVYFQNLAITSMMGVSRVPPIAAAWTQNFQWSMGIINVAFMQKIFHWYVQATKGVSTVVLANKDVLSISVQKKKRFLSLMERAVSVASSSDYSFDTLLDDSSLYTTTERDPSEYASKILVLRGIERVAYLANVELSNFFLTGVVFFLFFLFVVVVCLIFFKALIEVLTRARLMKETSNFFQYRKTWGSIIKGTLFRLAIIAFPQLTLLTIWEFTQKDSPAVVVDAVVILLIICGLLIYGTVRVFLKGRQSTRLYKTPAYLLYGDSGFLNRYGFLYVQFKADRFWWLLPLLAYGFLRSLFVAVLQTHGKAQALIVFIIELAYFGCLCWIRPYLDKRTNIFNIVIHLITLVNSIIFLFFSNLFKQPPVASSILAVVLFVLNAVFALFLLVFTIITCTLALLHRNPDARYQPMKDDRVSFIPKIQTSESGFKTDPELFEMRKAVMDTNETEQEKTIRLGAFGNTAGTNKTFFEDEMSTQSPSSSPNRNRSYSDNIELQPVQPTSALGDRGGSIMPSSPYQRVPQFSPATSRSNLQKPETSFYSNNNSSSNPYSSRRNNNYL